MHAETVTTASPSIAPQFHAVAPVATIAPASPTSSADSSQVADIVDELPIHSTGNKTDTVAPDVLKNDTSADEKHNQRSKRGLTHRLPQI
jgi:hypothetical protein